MVAVGGAADEPATVECAAVFKPQHPLVDVPDRPLGVLQVSIDQAKITGANLGEAVAAEIENRRDVGIVGLVAVPNEQGDSLAADGGVIGQNQMANLAGAGCVGERPQAIGTRSLDHENVGVIRLDREVDAAQVDPARTGDHDLVADAARTSRAGPGLQAEMSGLDQNASFEGVVAPNQDPVGIVLGLRRVDANRRLAVNAS